MECDQCFGNGRSNVPGAYFCIGCRGTGIKPEEKPFDITKHEFGADEQIIAELSKGEENWLLLRQVVNRAVDVRTALNKADAIAIAKALGVTAEDLS